MVMRVTRVVVVAMAMMVVLVVIVTMVMVMVWREEEMRDSVRQRIHHEFWNGQKIISPESSFVVSV